MEFASGNQIQYHPQSRGKRNGLFSFQGENSLRFIYIPTYVGFQDFILPLAVADKTHLLFIILSSSIVAHSVLTQQLNISRPTKYGHAATMQVLRKYDPSC